GRCHTADLARNLGRRCLQRFPRGAVVEQTARRLRELRPALEPLTVSAAPDVSRATRVAVIIPALNESESIGPVVASLPCNGVDRIIVADGGSTDDTVQQAKRAGAEVISVGRGY